MIIFYFSQFSQGKEAIQPAIQPASFDAQTEITVTYDVTGTPLENLSEAYLWVWIPNTTLNAKYNVNPASSDQELANHARLTKNIDGGKTTFSITFKPQDFFSDLICHESQLGILLKGNDWIDGQTTDFVTDLTPLAQCFVVNLTAPVDHPAFIDPGGTLSVIAESSMPATFTLMVDGNQVDQKASLKNYTFNYTIPQNSGIYPVELTVSDAQNDTTIAFSYLVNTPSEFNSRPAGIIPGINYDQNDQSKATVCLYAPGKSAVYLLGEFNNFEITPANKIFRDGDYFWAEITGLTPGKEYAYQYLVDGVFVADPFADKILDPLDKYIPESIYPGLKSYPKAALRDHDYKNRLSIIQTGQTPFQWQHETQHPDKNNLTIYELLVRDFFAPDDRNYLNLIDTLSYLKRLGVNAIELMPVMEFSGNDSWGYNPTFMFAPDKAYGTKTALKKFIDAAHGQGMAVILDIVFNHQELPNPYVAMWFDFNTFKVTPDNPMFNVEATHDYSVFYDMNHESPMTQYYVDTTLNYWTNQFKADGFRFDLSKGFTQKITKGNITAWGQYDASRIQILERIAQKVWTYSPDSSYMVLEHFADNTEEKVLADYGFMLWGNEHNDYKQAILGYPNSSDFKWAYYQSRDWSKNNLVSYYESHDEQRQMFDAENSGNASGNYHIKDTVTALNRMKLAAAFLYTIPGPKLFWQFGELGYDYDIDYNGRTGAKPVRWDYYQDPERLKLFKVQAAILNLRNNLDVFKDGTMTWKSAGPVRYILIKDNQMALVVAGNFDVTSHVEDIPFSQSGTWFDLFSDKTIDISGNTKSLMLEPGEFHVFTSQKIEGIESGLVPWWQDIAITALEKPSLSKLVIYPNPAHHRLYIMTNGHAINDVQIHDLTGKLIDVGFQNAGDSFEIDTRTINSGLYLLQYTLDNELHTFKIIIQ